MRHPIMIIPLAFTFRINARELLERYIADPQIIDENLVDMLAHRLLDGALQSPRIPYVVRSIDLENATLGRPSAQLAAVRSQSLFGLTGAALGAGSALFGVERPTMLRSAVTSSFPTFTPLVGRTLPRSEPRRARIGLLRAVKESDRTIAALDGLLGDMSADEADSSIASSTRRESENGTVHENGIRRGRTDQRKAFRSLISQSKRQLYISAVLSMKARRKSTKSIEKDMEPLDWLEASDLGPNLDKLLHAGNAAEFDGANSGESHSQVHRETMLPVIEMSSPVAPGGELLTLNLFEPRWVTLFAKLIADNSSSRLLRSAGGYQDVNLDTDGVLSKAVKLYEANASDTEERERLMRTLKEYPFYGTPVPGHGRLDESSFVGTKRFGVCLQPYNVIGRERIASVGTVMEVVGTDVKKASNGMTVLIVVARGVERFRATRIRQKRPYFVVDTLPLADENNEDDEEDDKVTRGKITEMLGGEAGGVVPFVIQDVQTQEKLLVTDQQTDEVAAITSEARGLSVFALANMLLKGRPELAQSLLASTKAAERREMVEKLLAAGEEPQQSNWGRLVLLVMLILAYFVQNYNGQ